MYINCKTYFSYRYGTFSAEKLVAAAVEAGARTLALTNINNTSDVWDFVKHCTEAKIKPVVGVEIRNDSKLAYILLAGNNEGFERINRFLSSHLTEKKPFPEKPDFPGDVFIIYPFSKSLPEAMQEHEFIGIQSTQINKLFSLDLQGYNKKLILLQPVTFADKSDYNLHRLLRAIDKNIIGTKQLAEDLAGKHERFIPIGELMKLFKDYPEMISNTFQLMDRCSISMDYKSDKNKKYYTVSKEDDRELLFKLALDGLQYRYGTGNKEAMERIEKELKIIDQQNFTAYFLITWDLLKYAAARGFPHVGRGSGANSIVAYCLRITDVDPIELDLYFERFLNPHRTSPPDFDIDFSWKDRDEMIDYVFKRYGKDHVALLGMFATFQFSASVRELGKVYGLPKTEIDGLCDGEFKASDKIHMQIYHFAKRMKDFPNHQSIHPGGMLISQLPIYNYTAVDLPPKGFRSTQIDMFVAEDIGLFKFDILSQRGLGHIKETITLVKQTRGIDIDIQQVEQFKKDPMLAANIRVGNTIGCFYIESPSMRQLLKKLRCDDYLRLVAASSIIRPGVGQSGMMQQYIYRFHNPDKFEYLHPKMKELLSETYGVMVYQEDVIKVAHHFGGLDMGEADILRRAMSGKYRGTKEMERLEAQFFLNCKQRGYPEKISNEVWRQIASFAGYSFSKAHSASFAVESYQSLFLKTYFPVEFMVAVINNFGGFYSRELYFHELRRTGVEIELPCVNDGDYLTSIVKSRIFVGFIHIKGFEQKMAERIISERQMNGHYKDLENFMDRSGIGEEQIKLLIKIGALRFTGKSKRQLLWQAGFLASYKKKNRRENNMLFEREPFELDLPNLGQSAMEDMLQELQLMEFTLGNVFDLVDDDPARYCDGRDLHTKIGIDVCCLGYLVCTKITSTKKEKKFMFFGTWLDANGDWMDSVHFPESAKRHPIKGRGFYRLSGKVIQEFGVCSLAVEKCEKIGLKDLDTTLETEDQIMDVRALSNQVSYILENSATEIKIATVDNIPEFR